MKEYIIYIGTSEKAIPAFPDGDPRGGTGITVLRMDENGKMTKQSEVISPSASVTCISNDHKYLYAVNEKRNFDHGLPGSGGGISSFRIGESGDLTPLNTSLSYGSNPAYPALSEDGKYLAVCNHGSHSSAVCSYVLDEDGNPHLERHYDDSSLAVFEILSDGSIGRLTDLKTVTGNSYYDQGRGQSTAFLHCVLVQGTRVYACDRGSDLIRVFDLQDGKLTHVKDLPEERGFAPRYITSDGEALYVCFENFPYAAKYVNEEKQGICLTVSEECLKDHPLPLPEGEHCPEDLPHRMFVSRYSPADICVNPACDALYVSNRTMTGEEAVPVIGVIDRKTFEKLCDPLVIDDRNPRGIGVSPDGKFLVIAGMHKGTVTAYRLDEKGRPLGVTSAVPVSGCGSVRFHTSIKQTAGNV